MKQTKPAQAMELRSLSPVLARPDAGDEMAVTKGRPAAGRIAEAILGFVSEIPATSEPINPSPKDRALQVARAAARKACTISGALALPLGPAGLVTILPDLVAVWRVQAQMVADIAGAFGKSAVLSRE
jgi:hypothetical protein